MPHLGILHFVQPYVVLLLYLGTIPVFLLSVFWRPIVGLLYVIPLLPLESVRFAMHGFPLGRSFVDIILLGVILGLLSRHEFSMLRSPFGIIVIVIAGYTYLSMWKSSMFDGLPLPLWFNDPRVSNWKNHVIVPMVVFICVLSTIRTTRDMKVLLLVMCLSMGVMNKQLYGTAREHTYASFDYAQRAESFENGMGSNELGALEAQFCLFLLGLRAFERRRSLRWAYLGLATLSGYCVMVSFSRGAYAALLVGWTFLAIVKERKLGLALIVFLASWQAIVPGAVRDRVLMTYDKDTGTLEDSSATRVTLWEDALEAFQQEPVFGKGYNSYPYLGRLGWGDTHNFYVKLIFELGVIGLGIFLCLFWKLYRVGYRLFRSAQDPFLASLGLGLAGWMVCAVIANIFGDRWSYVQITGYMWTIAACVVRGLTITNEKSEQAPAEVAELASV